MWGNKELEGKRKLRYYKKVINPNLEIQNYFYVLTSVKKKMNIAKIKTKSHELHSETGSWAVPKIPWMERICHLCENMNIEDENHFLLECFAYNHIRSQFHNLCCNTDLPNLTFYDVKIIKLILFKKTITIKILLLLLLIFT